MTIDYRYGLGLVIDSADYGNGILLFWPTVRKKCSSGWNIFLKFKADGREFRKKLRSLERFIQTVKGQKKFYGNIMRF